MNQRYMSTGKKNEQGEIFRAIGKCRAVNVDSKLLAALQCSEIFEFVAPWGESMVCKKGDMLVCPIIEGAITEIYRIAAKEFKETYR